MKSIYITVVSSQYVAISFCLAKALTQQGKRFAIYCVDDEAADFLYSMPIPNGNIYRPIDFESERVKQIKQERSVSEYCWTCKSIALQHALDNISSIEWAVYLDSDIMVYADPDESLPEHGHVLLTPHYPSTPHFEDYMANVGDYNAGYIAFRNTTQGRAALSWWRNQCEVNCSVITEANKYGDQYYLNQMAVLFEGVVKNSHKGLNTAPWNILGKIVVIRDSRVYIDDDPLLVYHMQGFRIIAKNVFDLYCGEVRIPKSVRYFIYMPYVSHIQYCISRLPCKNPRLYVPLIHLPKYLLRELKRIVFGISNILWQPTLLSKRHDNIIYQRKT
ncbi:hypothetical protein AB835_08625 [Candidatus Endobugula sertula]|uniref:Nucleotide-diphospho-sugar transferase domain-containing protein n=1 Tax=Candidatus Endobugula sertula TaxID=62101 RepID=A0A1D2QPH8_9GAMM|nr:hypothetical protein AB835_08625 [Candidatus Endobugula sertula]